MFMNIPIVCVAAFDTETIVSIITIFFKQRDSDCIILCTFYSRKQNKNKNKTRILFTIYVQIWCLLMGSSKKEDQDWGAKVLHCSDCLPPWFRLNFIEKFDNFHFFSSFLLIFLFSHSILTWFPHSHNFFPFDTHWMKSPFANQFSSLPLFIHGKHYIPESS